jgi:hypothetical protein
LPARGRNTLPLAVILKRLAADFFVLIPFGRRIIQSNFFKKSAQYTDTGRSKQGLFSADLIAERVLLNHVAADVRRRTNFQGVTCLRSCWTATRFPNSWANPTAGLKDYPTPPLRNRSHPRLPQQAPMPKTNI